MGYASATTGANNNFRVIPFCDPGYNTSDIQQLQLSDGGQNNIGWGAETFAIWEGVPTVVDGSEFFYYDPLADVKKEETTYYWGDAKGNKVAFSIASAQGIVVNSAADLAANTAGQVPTKKVSFTTVSGNNFTGNPFPSEIDIQAIALDDGGQNNIGWGAETFAIWEGVPTVVVGSEFFYYDPSADVKKEETTYYWGDAKGNKVTYPIAPGQGVVINCAAGLTISIEPPYSL